MFLSREEEKGLIVKDPLFEIVLLWASHATPFGFSLFQHFLGITFQLF